MGQQSRGVAPVATAGVRAGLAIEPQFEHLCMAGSGCHNCPYGLLARHLRRRHIHPSRSAKQQAESLAIIGGKEGAK